MCDPKRFLKPTLFTVTPAAAIVLRALEEGGREYGLQRSLQADHMGCTREMVPRMNPTIHYVLVTKGPYCLRVVDSILPEDFQRRSVICMDTEVQDIQRRMFIASGLYQNLKKE